MNEWSRMKHLTLLGVFGLLSPLIRGAEVELPHLLDAGGFQEVLAVSGDVYIAGQPDKAGLGATWWLVPPGGPSPKQSARSPPEFVIRLVSH